MKTVVWSSAIAILAGGFHGGAIAQANYPNKPIRLLVGFAPGGGTDTIARIVAQRLGDVLGQQVVIDNRAGANQIIASEIVAGARPDGYTLFMASAGFAINPAMQEKLPFDSIKDFTPITMAATAPNVLVAQPSLALKSIPDLIALARQKPNQLLYGSGGVGTPSHLSGALFASLNKIRLEHVPYKGSGPALAAMLGGEFQIAFPQLSTGIPHIKSGKLVALGVTTSRRSAFMPDLPTVAESGTPGYEASSWAGLMGPASLPKQIVVKLSDATNRLLKEAEIIDKLFNQGAEVVGGSPEQFAAVVSREIAQWKKLVASEGLNIKN